MDPEPSEPQLVRARFLGEAAWLLGRLPSHRHRPCKLLTELFVPAFRHGHYRIFYDASGDPVGLVLWALITIEVESRILRTRSLNLHLSEWNEGSRLWLLDFTCEPEVLAVVLTECREMFRAFDEVSFCKDYGDRQVFRILGRDGLDAILARLCS